MRIENCFLGRILLSTTPTACIAAAETHFVPPAVDLVRPALFPLTSAAPDRGTDGTDTSAPGVPGAAAPAARSVAPAALADRLRAARPGVHPGPRVTTAEPGRRARAASTFLR